MSKLPSSNKQVSIQEAAKILGVSDKTLRRWEESGKLTPNRTKGGHRRYSLAKLEYFKSAQKSQKARKRIESVTPIYPAPSPFQPFPVSKQVDTSNNLSSSEKNTTEPLSLYQPLHIDQKKALKNFARFSFALIALLLISKVASVAPKLATKIADNSNFAENVSLLALFKDNDLELQEGSVLADRDSLLSSRLDINIDTNFDSNVGIAGILNLGGNTITSSGELLIEPGAGNLVIAGNTEVNGDFSAVNSTLSGSQTIAIDLSVAGDTTVAGNTTTGSLTINEETFTDLTGTGLTLVDGVLTAALGTDISSAEISDGTIVEADLSITNTPTDNQILSYDSSTGTFTWVDDETGDLSLFTDGGTITYLTSQTDDLALGGTTASSPFYFDVSTGVANFTGDLSIGSIALSATGSDETNSGASLIGIFDEFTNSSSTNVQDVLDDFDAALGAGGSKFSQDTGFIYLSNTTDGIVLGGTSSLSSKFAIDGDADEIQLLVQGNSTQTSNIAVFENSAGTDLVTIDNSGNLVIAGGITVNSENITDFSGNGLTVTSNALTVQTVSATDALSSTVSNGSGLEVFSTGISLLQGCANGEVLKWNETNDSWECSTDSGAAFAIVNIENNEATVGSNVDTIDFSTDFSVTASPSNEANVAIADDILNFTELSDSLSLDASTDIALGALTLSTSGTGALDFNSTGQVSFAGNVNAENGLDVTGASLTIGGSYSITTSGVITAATDETINGIDINSGAISDVTTLTLVAAGNQWGSAGLTATVTGDVTLSAGDDFVFDDLQLSTAITLTDVDTGFDSGDTAIVDAINTAYAAATGGGGGAWTVASNTIYPTSADDRVGIGTQTPGNIISKLYVTGDANLTGKSVAIFNQTESQDIFTASASGVTRFTVANNGNLIFEGTGADDAFETTFSITNPTADRTITFQDSSGTVAFLTDIPTSDNYVSWSFAVDGVTQDPITSGDILDFVSGSGITVTRSADDQITLTAADTSATNELQNVFQTISVSGQSDVVSDANSDTLTFAAGSGVTITTDAGTDTVTISATGTGGDITAVNAGTGLSGGGITGDVTLDLDATEIDSITFSDGVNASNVWTFDISGTTDPTLTFSDGSIATNGTFSATQLISTVTTGTSPLTIASTTLVSNLNADLLDGQEGSYYLNASNINAGTLGTNFYSAYADLTAEGYLDNNAGTDLLTRDQLDARFDNYASWNLDVNNAGNDAITSGQAVNIDPGTGVSLAYDSGTNTVTISATGTGGDITDVGDVTSGAAFTQTAGNDGNSLWFEGSTVDGNELQLTAADVADDTTVVTLPAITGTLASLAGTQTFTGAKTFDDITIADTNISLSGATTTFTSTGALTLNVAGGDAAGEDLIITANNVSLAASGAFTISPDQALTTAIDLTDTDLTNAFSIGDNNIVGTTANIDLTNFDVVGSSGNTTIGGTLDVTGISTFTGNVNANGGFDVDNAFIIADGGNANLVDNTTLAFGTGNDFTIVHNGTNTIFDNTFATGASIFQLGTDTTATAFQILNNSGTELFQVNGAGSVQLGSEGLDGQLVLYNELGATDYNVIFNLSGAQTQDTTYTLPPNDGDADYVLVTNGSGVLTWQSVTGTGGAGDITAVGDVTSGEAFTTGTPGTSLSFGNGGNILDANGNQLLTFTTTASAINELTLANAAVGNNPSLTSTGGDSNIGLNLIMKADGELAISSTTANTDTISIKPQTSTATNRFDGQITSLDLTADRTWSFPNETGTVCLTSGNCAGVGGTGDISGSGTTGQIAFFTDTKTISSEASGFAWNSTNNTLSIGTDTSLSRLFVQTDNTATLGKAAAIFNQTENQDVISASASGTPLFTLQRDGDLDIAGDIYVGGNDLFDSTDTSRITLGATTTFTNTTTTFSGTTTLNGSSLTAINLGAATITTPASGSLTFNLDGGNAAGEDLIITANNISLAATGAFAITPDAALTTAIDLTDTDLTNALSIGDNNIIGTTAAIDFTNFDVATTGNITVAAGVGLDTNGAGALALGGTNATSLTIGNGTNTTSITLSSNTTGDATVVLPTGAISGTEILDNTITATDLAATLSFADGDYLDLSSIVHTNSTNEGIRLPSLGDTANKPTAGAGFIAYDTGSNIPRYFDGSDWQDFSGASTTLQDAYNFDTDTGDTIIALTSADDSLIFRNPDGTGTDSSFLLQLENVDTTANELSDYLLLTTASTDTTTDAIDVSDAGFFNAINVGANNIAGTTAVINFDNFDVASTGNITVAAGVGLDTNGAGILALGGTNATSLTIGNGTNTTSITLSSNTTGNGTVVLPNDAIGTAEILDNTITATDLAATLSFADGDFLDLSAINHSTNAIEGFKLPQASLASGPSVGDGFLAFDTDDSQVKVWYSGSWNSIAGASTTLQQSYDADNNGSDTIVQLTANDDSLIFRNPSSSGSDSSFLLSLDQLNTTGEITVLDITNDGLGTSLFIQDGSKGKAAAIINQSGAQDVFTASASGTTVFTIANNGNLVSTGDLTLQNDVDTTGAGNITLNFGGTNPETLLWNASTDRFDLSDDLNISGALTASGAITFSSLSTNGYVKTTGGTGALSVSTTVPTTDLSGTLFTFSDGTTPQTVAQAETMNFVDGTDIDFVTSATRNVTANNTSTLSTVTGRGASTTTFVELDGGFDVDGAFTVANGGAVTSTIGFTSSGGEFLFSGGNAQFNDSIALTFGTGDDFSISFNGTNTLLTSSAGDINITSAGEINFDDATTGIIPFAADDTALNGSLTNAIVDAINETYAAATGGTGGVWALDTGTIYPTTLANRVGIGTQDDTAIISKLYVTSEANANLTGKSVAIFNQNEAQDILTASASGVTRFTVANNGNLIFEGTGADDANETTFSITNPTADRTITFQDASGTVAFLTDIPTSDNYVSWTFAVDGSNQDAITSADVLNFVSGEGIDITRSAEDQLTIAGEDATSANKGIASFAASYFTVTSGDVAITADGLNLTEISNALLLDEATTITNNLTANLTIDLTSTGDFVISDSATPFATFTDSGTFILDSLTFDGTSISSSGALTLNSTSADLNLNTTTSGNVDINVAGEIIFSDTRTGDIQLSQNDSTLPNSNIGIIDAINDAYNAATGGGGGLWTLTGTTLIRPTDLTDNIGIGTSTEANAISKLYVTNDSSLTGKSLAIFNQTESQDILSASASGVTKFIVGNDGNLAIRGTNLNNNISINSTVEGEGANAIGLYNTFATHGYNSYGVYNDITAIPNDDVIGVFTGGNLATGLSGVGIWNNFETDNTWRQIGVYNDITQGSAYGMYNTLSSDAYTFSSPIGGSNDDNDQAYGIFQQILSGDDGGSADTVYGAFTSLATHPNDIGYGYYVDDLFSPSSTGGTQYGVYVDLDDADVTNYSLYVANGSGQNYFGTNTNINGITNLGDGGSTNYASFSTTGDLTFNGSADTIVGPATFNLLDTATTTLNFAGAATALDIGPAGASGSISLSGGSGDTGCTLDGTTGGFTCSGQISGATIDTALTQGSVVFAGASGVLSQDNTNFFWNDTLKTLSLGTNDPVNNSDSRLFVTGNSTLTGKSVAIFDQTESQEIFSASASGVTRFTVANNGNLIFEGTGADDANETTFSITNPTADRTITFQDASGTVAFLTDIPTSDNYVSWTIGDGSTTTPIVSGEQLNITGGAGIDTSLTEASPNVLNLVFDATELGALTWNNGTSDASFAWTFDLNAGTDPVITFSDNNVGLNSNLSVAGTTGLTLSGTGGQITFANGETIDNDTNGTVNIGATTLQLTGGTSIVSDQATVALLNTNTTTVNAFGAATALNINDAAVTSTIDIGGVTADGANTINIATNGTSADVISIGNSNASTTLALTGGDDWSITTAGVGTFTQLNVDNLTLDANTLSSTTGNLTLAPVSASNLVFTLAGGGEIQIDGGLTDIGSGTYSFANGDNDLGVAGDLEVLGTIYGTTFDTTFTAGSVVFAGASGVLSENNASFFWDNAAETLSLGTNNPANSSDSRLFVTGNSTLTGKSLAIFDQTESQDILTASASGTTRLTLDNSGDLLLATGSLYTNDSYGLVFGTDQDITALFNNTDTQLEFDLDHNAGIELISDLSGGERNQTFPAALRIFQANNVTYDFDDTNNGFFEIFNQDSGSSAPLIYLDNDGIGPAIKIDGISGTSSGSVGIAINLSTWNGGDALTFDNIASTIGPRELINIGGGGGSGVTTAFTGDLIVTNFSRTYSGSFGITDTGNYLDLTRNRTNSGSGTYANTGDLATFSSNCTQTSGTCTDTSNILSLAQNYANATGDVLEITNAGSGDDIELVSGGTINATSGNLGLTTTTSGNIALTPASAGNVASTLSGGGEFQIDGGLTDIGSGSYSFADGDNDLGVAGDLEVVGTLYANGAVTAIGNVTTQGYLGLNIDSNANNILNTAAGSATTDDLYWGNTLLCDVSEANCGFGAGTSQWTFNAGSLYATTNPWETDILIGSNATSSAEFAFINMAGGTPTFKALDNNQLVLGTGNDLTVSHSSSTNNTTFTSITGDLLFDNTNTTGTTGFILGTDTTATSFEILNNSLTTLFSFDGSGDLRIFDSTGADYISLLHNGTNATITTNAGELQLGSGAGDVYLGTSTTAVNLRFAEDDTGIYFGTDNDYQLTYDAVGDNRLEITDGTNLLLALTDTGTTGDLLISGDLTVSGGDIVGAATTNLLNAATTVNLGSTDIARAINIGTGTGIDTINIGTGSTGADVISIGQAAASLSLTDADWNISTAGVFTTNTGTNSAINLTRSSAGQWISFADGTDTWGLYNVAGSPDGVLTANIGALAMDTSNGTLYVKTTANGTNTDWTNLATGGSSQWTLNAGSLYATTNPWETDVLIGSNATSSAEFAFTNMAGGTPTFRSLDNNLTAYGTASDATITYDGTNLVVNPDAVGTGYVDVQGSFGITDTDNTNASFFLTNNTATTIGAGVNTLGVADISSSSLTTGNLLNLETTTSLTTGRVLNASSTSTALTTGQLGRFDWSPGSAWTSTGDLFSINIGSLGSTTGSLFNVLDNGSSLFKITESKITSALPHEFTAAGDVSFAYDIQFTNQTASYIKSNSPLTIQSGETFESNNLTLSTFNSGEIVFENGDSGVIGRIEGEGTYTFTNTNDALSGKAVLILDQEESQDIFTASISGTTAFTIDSEGETVITLDGDATASEALCGNQADGDAADTAGVKISDCTTTVTADYMEMYPVEQGIEVGEIVTVGTNNVTTTEGDVIKQLVRSNSAYQESVVGVISDPEKAGDFNSIGYNIDENDNPMPVALSGRVPVKVAISSDPIQAGDPIAASSVAGRAMKATAAGKIIGVALSDWNPGQESVMILVNNTYYTGNLATESNIADLETRISDLELQISGLTATDSAVFTDLSLDNLTVTGDTLLGDTFIAGTLDVGTLQFDGVNNSLDAVGILKIQPLALGNVEFMGGLITMTTDGNIEAKEITAEKYNVAGASAGTDTLPANTIKVFVETAAVEANSLIFVNAKSAIFYPLSVTEKVVGSGFWVEIYDSEPTDTIFDWFIVDKVQ